MGKWYDTKVPLVRDFFMSGCDLGKVCLIKKDELKDLKGSKDDPHFATRINRYARDISKYITPDKSYLIAFGDLKIFVGIIRRDTDYKLDDLPIIVKAAFSSQDGERKRAGIIAKLHTERHWVFGNTYANTSWQNKKDECTWRGGVTGISPLVLNAPLDQADVLAQEYDEYINMPRLRLVRRYYKKYDIGFSIHRGRNPNKGTGVTGTPGGDTPCWNKLLKPYATPEEQLKNKYQIALEGNDVASGLKWQLLSNSLVIMPKPTMITWAMEDTLVPYEHYVPLADSLDNLDEVLQWCRENDSTCKEIAENATQYMQQFMDYNNEEKITKEIISRYDRNVSWE